MQLGCYEDAPTTKRMAKARMLYSVNATYEPKYTDIMRRGDHV